MASGRAAMVSRLAWGRCAPAAQQGAHGGAAALRRCGGGVAGIKRGRVRGGRVEREEAHRGLDLGGRRPERGVRWRGRSSASSVMAAGGREADSVGFGRGQARERVEEAKGEAREALA